MGDTTELRSLFISDQPVRYFFDYAFHEPADGWLPTPRWYDLPLTQEHRLVSTAIQGIYCSINISDGMGFKRFDYVGPVEPPPGVALCFHLFRHCRSSVTIVVRIAPQAPFVGTLRVSHDTAEGEGWIYTQVTSLSGHHWVARWDDETQLTLEDISKAVKAHMTGACAVAKKTEIRLVQPCGELPPELIYDPNGSKLTVKERVNLKSPPKKVRLNPELDPCDGDALDGKFGIFMAAAGPDQAQTESSDSEEGL